MMLKGTLQFVASAYITYELLGALMILAEKRDWEMLTMGFPWNPRCFPLTAFLYRAYRKRTGK